MHCQTKGAGGVERAREQIQLCSIKLPCLTCRLVSENKACMRKQGFSKKARRHICAPWLQPADGSASTSGTAWASCFSRYPLLPKGRVFSHFPYSPALGRASCLWTRGSERQGAVHCAHRFRRSPSMAAPRTLVNSPVNFRRIRSVDRN
jgi:hypothetical protein